MNCSFHKRQMSVAFQEELRSAEREELWRSEDDGQR
jgi:hypothetical protein